MRPRVTAEVFVEHEPELLWGAPCGCKRQWRFRIKGRNGEIIAQSEDYENKQDAIDTARLLAPSVTVIEP